MPSLKDVPNSKWSSLAPINFLSFTFLFSVLFIQLAEANLTTLTEAEQLAKQRETIEKIDRLDYTEEIKKSLESADQWRPFSFDEFSGKKDEFKKMIKKNEEMLKAAKEKHISSIAILKEVSTDKKELTESLMTLAKMRTTFKQEPVEDIDALMTIANNRLQVLKVNGDELTELVSTLEEKMYEIKEKVKEIQIARGKSNKIEEKFKQYAKKITKTQDLSRQLPLDDQTFMKTEVAAVERKIRALKGSSQRVDQGLTQFEDHFVTAVKESLQKKQTKLAPSKVLKKFSGAPVKLDKKLGQTLRQDMRQAELDAITTTATTLLPSLGTEEFLLEMKKIKITADEVAQLTRFKTLATELKQLEDINFENLQDLFNQPRSEFEQKMAKHYQDRLTSLKKSSQELLQKHDQSKEKWKEILALFEKYQSLLQKIMRADSYLARDPNSLKNLLQKAMGGESLQAYDKLRTFLKVVKYLARIDEARGVSPKLSAEIYRLIYDKSLELAAKKKQCHNVSDLIDLDIKSLMPVLSTLALEQYPLKDVAHSLVLKKHLKSECKKAESACSGVDRKKLLLAPDTKVTMFFPEAILDELLKSGEFYNQHETLKPTLSDFAPTLRAKTEDMMIGVKIDETYAPKANRKTVKIRPKYSYLAVRDPKKGLKTPYVPYNYGEVIAVFNDGVKHRSTLTAKDSLLDTQSEYQVHTFYQKIQDWTNLVYETQIWGPVVISRDVQYFLVKADISAENLAKLKGFGVIPIYEIDTASEERLAKGKLLYGGQSESKTENVAEQIMRKFLSFQQERPGETMKFGAQ